LRIRPSFLQNKPPFSQIIGFRVKGIAFIAMIKRQSCTSNKFLGLE
jgi:hypothetical protein